MLYTVLLYNLILFSSTALLYVSEKEKTAIGRRVCLVLAFLVTVIPNAIRYEIGSDYVNYVAIFEELAAGGTVYIEPGFLFLIYAVQSLGLGYEWLFAFIAIFIHLFAFLAYPKKNKYIAHLFFMLLFYFVSFSGMRQMMAVVIVMYAVKLYMLHKNDLKFYIMVLFASLFHAVGLVFLFIPLVTNNKYSQRLLVHVGRGSILLWTLTFVLGASFISIIGSLLSVLPFLDYSSYLSSDRYSASAEINTGLGVLVQACFYLYPLFFIKKLLKINKQYALIFALLIPYVLFWAFQKHIAIFYRPKQAFEFAIILVVLMVLSNKFIPFRHLYVLSLFLFLLFTFNKKIVAAHTNYMVTCNSGRLAPYVTVFNKKDSQRGSRVGEMSCYR